MLTGMTVSRLGARAGASPDTVRYYERIGLLPPADRSSSGYRLYGEDTVERVLFIKRAQRFGLRLEEIAELLDVRDQGLCPCGSTRRLLEAKVTKLDEEMDALRQLREDIQQMLEELPAREDGEPSRSGLLVVGRRPPVTKPSPPPSAPPPEPHDPIPPTPRRNHV